MHIVEKARYTIGFVLYTHVIQLSAIFLFWLTDIKYKNIINEALKKLVIYNIFTLSIQPVVVENGSHGEWYRNPNRHNSTNPEWSP